jgi:rubrerythrin
MKNSADYNLQVAIELEDRGRTFYESLSHACGDSKIGAFATAIAKDEEEHIEIFKRMRDALPMELRGPKLSDEELLAATDELRKKIIPNAGTVMDVVMSSDLCKALDMAIEMETLAVAFYTALASSIANLDVDVIQKVAYEEMAHLNKLREKRTLLLSA